MLEDQEDKPEAVGARLMRVREIMGLTKKEFADRAGLSEQAYGAYENGVRRLSLTSAISLRRAYKLPLDFMYFGNIADLPTRISRDL
jgi:transcriptional regulator with XRE-family HTH domain